MLGNDARPDMTYDSGNYTDCLAYRPLPQFGMLGGSLQ